MFLFLLMVSCTTKVPPIDVSEAEFTITNCEVLYKDKILPLGKPLNKWVKMFGTPRKSEYGFIWDKYSIGIEWLEKETGLTTDFYLFFKNLDSPLGQAGKLSYARSWLPIDEKAFTEYDPNFPDVRPYTKKEVEKLKEEYHPKKYFYPFTTYKNIVNIEGAAVAWNMTIDEVNHQRALVGKEKFGYRDVDANGVNEEMSTTRKNGEYYSVTDPVGNCNRENNYFMITLGMCEGEIEYIRVRYRKNKNDMISL